MRAARLAALALVFFASSSLAKGPAKTHAKKRVAPRHVARAAKHYGSYVRNWHTPDPDRAPLTDPAGRPLLVLYAINTRERVTLHPLGAEGGFSAEELDRAAHLLRDPRAGNEHPVEPRLLDAIYRIQVHFHAQEIRVISGYRTPHGGHSNHGKGRAMDVVVPGTHDADVARFARGMGFMGVGLYPVSGFVHVDVRDRSYFWVDYSGPGRRNRERGILGKVAAAADERARARGERGVPPFGVATDVDEILRVARPAPATTTPTGPPPDEDEDTP